MQNLNTFVDKAAYQACDLSNRIIDVPMNAYLRLTNEINAVEPAHNISLEGFLSNEDGMSRPLRIVCATVGAMTAYAIYERTTSWDWPQDYRLLATLAGGIIAGAAAAVGASRLNL